MKIHRVLFASAIIPFLMVGCDSSPAPVAPAVSPGDASANTPPPQSAKKRKKELSQGIGPEGLVP